MGDTALKRAQIVLEGPYTSGTSPIGNSSVYNGGSALSATRRIAIEESFGNDFKFTWDAPQEARGTYAGSYQHVNEAQMAQGKLPSLVYCDDTIWYGRMALNGAPTWVTLPNTPGVMLALTAIASTLTLTKQPTDASFDGAKAKMCAVTLSNTANTGSALTAVNVTIQGKDIYGRVISETLSFTSGVTTQSATMTTSTPYSSTLYTQNYFASIGTNAASYNNGTITMSATPAGDSVSVGGIDAFQYTFNNDMATSSLYSATMEYWDGSAAWQLPGCVMDKVSFDMQLGKSTKLDASFLAQQKLPLTATSASISPTAHAGTFNALTNLNDNFANAMTTYKTIFYADPIGSVPGTTAINARLTDLKVNIATGAKVGKAADGTPFGSFVGREYYKIDGELTLLFNSYDATLNPASDPAEVYQFLQLQSRTIRAAMPGPALPCGPLTATSNWPTALQQGGFGGYYGLMIDMAGKYEDMTEKKVDGRMAMSFKFGAEVDLIQMNALMVMTVVSRVNPNQL